MNTEQPEALRLAAWLNEGTWHQMRLGDVEAAGRELRRLHAENSGLRSELQAARDMPAGMPEPVAAESRFVATDKEWLRCSIEHARMVHAKPSAWIGYEARYLYTAEQLQAARAAAMEEAAKDRADAERWRAWVEMLSAMSDQDNEEHPLFASLEKSIPKKQKSFNVEEFNGWFDAAILAAGGAR